MAVFDFLLQNQSEGAPPALFALPAKAAWAGLLEDKDLAAFLQATNGLYAFDGALHLFGTAPAHPEHDLSMRNDVTAAWREPYEEDLAGILFFAEDAFGHLVGLLDSEVITFDPESGARESVGDGFAGWLKTVADDLDFCTGQSLVKAWAEAHGALPIGSRLSPLKPFVLGGEFEAANLRVLPWDENLGFMASVYSQIKDLPEGGEVELPSS